MVIHWEYLKEIMKVRGWTYSRLESECGTPKSTLQKLFNGESEDPRISSLYAPAKALGASIDRMLDLAPPRDFAAENRAYDATLMQTMQDRVNLQQNKLDEYSATISELKSELSAARAHVNGLESAIADKNAAISDYKSTISENKIYTNRIRTALIVSVVVLVGVCIVFVWHTAAMLK